MSLIAKVRRLATLPLKIVLFRVQQEIRLRAFKILRRWEKLSKNIKHNLSIQEVALAIKSDRLTPTLLHSKSVSKIKDAILSNEDKISYYRQLGKTVLDGSYSILGHPLPLKNNWSWHEDWRFKKIWSPKYFKQYSFYGPRGKPYDVKFPWELSRVQYLIPVLENAILFPDEADWLDYVHDTISDWQSQNPLAMSVAWYPMEASMRLTSYVQLLDLLLLHTNEDEKVQRVISVLVQLIAEHGHFVWETREYTDDCGNHYAANLAGLCLAGTSLRKIYAPAKKWLAFSQQEINREVLGQFTRDGVNFEKSTGYHRLVTELFLSSIIAQEKSGISVPQEVKDRLHKACQFSKSMCRPDGWAVNFGDNDNAKVWDFAGLHSRNHSEFLNISAAYFQDGTLSTMVWQETVGAIWLFGNTVDKNLLIPDEDGYNYYNDGGYLAVKGANNHFVMDVGEVGQNGKGGHGHNDLFSFELSLSGQAIVVDSGCPIYTGDLAKKDHYRSSFSHNGLMVDNTELADFLGAWRIKNDAVPKNIALKEVGATITLSGEHQAYARLLSPVIHCREVTIKLHEHYIACKDSLIASAPHVIQRQLYFSPDLTVENLEASQLVLIGPLGKYSIEWLQEAEAEVCNVMISNEFGSEIPSLSLVLRNSISKNTNFEFIIREIRE